jgi:N-acylglucosamine-6-phosphate 2-epimerase
MTAPSSPSNTVKEVIDSIDGAMIISCQASKGEPLNHPDHILALALSGINGGARGLRLEGVENIRRVKQALTLLYQGAVPIVGLTKSEISEEEKLTSVYITASFDDAKSLAIAGADIIALDATGRKRADGLTLKETIGRIHSQLNKAVWADCATLSEGLAAHEAGADIVSTTLYGYTAETVLPKEAGPNLDLLKEFVTHIKAPVILEGRVWHPQELTLAFELGAHAVVVGSAITRPQLITERFVKAIPSKRARPRAFHLLAQ